MSGLVFKDGKAMLRCSFSAPKQTGKVHYGTGHFQVTACGIPQKGKRLSTRPETITCERCYRAPFLSLPLSQQAAIRCSDIDFQQFMVERYSGPYPYRPTADNAAVMVRERCAVTSRALITEGDKSGDYWLDIEANFQRWKTDQNMVRAVDEMPIKITDDPEVSCTAAELARYQADYQHRFMMFAGKRPTLAEFIRREQTKSKRPT